MRCAVAKVLFASGIAPGKRKAKKQPCRTYLATYTPAYSVIEEFVEGFDLIVI
jgi:hypothetical protein